MNEEEIQSLIKQLKAAGLGDEEIMETFYETFENGEMDRKDLETLAEAMGYELTDDFKNDAQPDPMAAPADEPEAPAEGGDAGDMSKEQLEDAKEINPGESVDEFKDKLGVEGEEKPEDKPEDKPEESNDEDDDEKGWAEAQKMFKI